MTNGLGAAEYYIHWTLKFLKFTTHTVIATRHTSTRHSPCKYVNTTWRLGDLETFTFILPSKSHKKIVYVISHDLSHRKLQMYLLQIFNKSSISNETSPNLFLLTVKIMEAWLRREHLGSSAVFHSRENFGKWIKKRWIPAYSSSKGYLVFFRKSNKI